MSASVISSIGDSSDMDDRDRTATSDKELVEEGDNSMNESMFTPFNFIKSTHEIFQTTIKGTELYQETLKPKEKRKTNMCVHNRKQPNCKDCGGSYFCVHKRRKNDCQECGGSSICIHKRRKVQCKECGGSSICIHQRVKSTCKDCGGSGICIHQRIKTDCKDCGGSRICIHKNFKRSGRECRGIDVCIHNKQLSKCKTCGKCSASNISISLPLSQATKCNE